MGSVGFYGVVGFAVAVWALLMHISGNAELFVFTSIALLATGIVGTGTIRALTVQNERISRLEQDLERRRQKDTEEAANTPQPESSWKWCHDKRVRIPPG